MFLVLLWGKAAGSQEDAEEMAVDQLLSKKKGPWTARILEVLSLSEFWALFYR